MAGSAVAQLLYLMDEAFEGNEWHSLLANLRSVRPEEWAAAPPTFNAEPRTGSGHHFPSDGGLPGRRHVADQHGRRAVSG